MSITVDRTQELQWVKEGRVFCATGAGVLTTPAAFQTDLVRQTPDLMVRTGSGIVIVPLRVQVSVEASNATGVFQALISACNNDPGVSSMTAVTPVNVNTRYSAKGSSCTAYNTNVGNTGTAPAGVPDLLRVYVQPDIDAITGVAHFEQVVYAPLWGAGTPCIVGEEDGVSAFLVYTANSTDGTGYILAAWAEFTYAEFYAP